MRARIFYACFTQPFEFSRRKADNLISSRSPENANRWQREQISRLRYFEMILPYYHDALESDASNTLVECRQSTPLLNSCDFEYPSIRKQIRKLCWKSSRIKSCKALIFVSLCSTVLLGTFNDSSLFAATTNRASPRCKLPIKYHGNQLNVP